MGVDFCYPRSRNEAMRLTHSRFSKSPLGAVLLIALVVLGGEFLIMVAIELVFKPLMGPKIPDAFWDLLDPVLLTLLAAPALYFSVLRPLTAQQQLLERQRDELGIAAVTFDSLEGIVVTDERHVILKVNNAFTTVTGYTSAEAVGKTPAILHSGRQTPEFYRRMRETLQRDGHWQGEIWNRRKNGEIYPEWLTITAVTGTHGNINYVGIFSDITLRKAYEEKISFLAFHDRLTGLASRELLYERLSQAISQARRKYDRLALLFMDLDGFKAVNDNYGHEAGDELLKTVARRMQLCIRDEDTAARMGGDEFAIVLGGIEEITDASPAAEKLIQKLSEPYRLPGGQECTIGVSIGIAIFPEDGAELDKLMSVADTAMYHSKAKGRNTYTYANEQMRKDGQWVKLDSSYLFGIAEIDRQHHELADMLNRLNAAVQDNQPEAVIAGLFHEFIGQIQTHFESEERLMELHGHDLHGVHRKEHQRLIGEVAYLNENLSRGSELAVLQSLKDWLLGHVQGLDRQMSEALLQRGVK